MPLVVFSLDEQHYALYLPTVDRVVRAVEIAALTKTPQAILGVVNVQGRVVPVFDVRQRFGLPSRPTMLTDQLILAHTAHRPVALMADAVVEIVECSARQIVEAEHILPGIAYMDGILKLDSGLILIHSLDKFLSLDEEQSLAEALETP